MTRQNTLLLIAIALIVIAATGVAVPWLLSPAQQGSQVTGTALVGGPFELTDQDGKRVTDKDFRGKFMLVYFGYTFCPDVCPTELQAMTTAVTRLGEDAKRVQPIFITVDPERDTVEQMKTYVSNFDGGLIGLTGSTEDIVKATQAYRIYFAKVKDESSSAEYLMDHTSLVFLMDENGTFRRVFSYGTDADTMAKGIKEELAKS
ncbi:SCO family protein [Rhodoligotrophos defluvii]|uniref:SCO family protein n=1 Tax=Rhodoligotrophos defluvii TaxID=2561934 RepID=UPI0010C9BBD4|nr:SCO family protein [Rhodoligotrophos defluvii]